MPKVDLANALTSGIQKVERDYYIHFSNIKGEKLSLKDGERCNHGALLAACWNSMLIRNQYNFLKLR